MNERNLDVSIKLILMVYWLGNILEWHYLDVSSRELSI